MSDDRTATIRKLNDEFRTTLRGGKTFFTAGVSELGAAFIAAVLATVRNFTAFSADNDPYEEHDFASFDIGDRKLFWKIDYYDLSLKGGSRDPADPAITTRVLTIMLADEY